MKADVLVKATLEFLRVNIMKNKFTMHLLGLVHLPSSREYQSCAFTLKNVKLSKMLCSLGHTVYFYGAKTTNKNFDIEKYVDSENFIFVETHTVDDIAKDYGEGDNRFELKYFWKNRDFKHDFSSERNPSTLKYYANAIEHINKIKKADDFLLNTMGYYFKPVEDAVKLFLSVESGIGYRGSYPGHYRCFESTFIQNFTYGSENPFADMNGNFYDRVIGNYFDPGDFEPSYEKGSYYFFIGRMIKRKGIEAAVLACNALGKKLIIAGQGASVRGNGHLIPNLNADFDIAPGTWEYVGFADMEKRKNLFAGAIATFTPTLYQECFGGTHVESRLSGTPCITTDFGVYANTVENGIDGYKCNTLDDFVQAAKRSDGLDRKLIRKRAEKYLMDNIKYEYQQWFDDLYCVWENTVNPNKKGFSRIRTIEPEWRKMLYYNQEGNK
jgi:glycosyltransferase involved in cell wall biosynthesis